MKRNNRDRVFKSVSDKLNLLGNIRNVFFEHYKNNKNLHTNYIYNCWLVVDGMIEEPSSKENKDIMSLMSVIRYASDNLEKDIRDKGLIKEHDICKEVLNNVQFILTHYLEN